MSVHDEGDGEDTVEDGVDRGYCRSSYEGDQGCRETSLEGPVVGSVRLVTDGELDGVVDVTSGDCEAEQEGGSEWRSRGLARGGARGRTYSFGGWGRRRRRPWRSASQRRNELQRGRTTVGVSKSEGSGQVASFKRRGGAGEAVRTRVEGPLGREPECWCQALSEHGAVWREGRRCEGDFEVDSLVRRPSRLTREVISPASGKATARIV